MTRPTVLLSSVFGPFGVDDAYGRKENIMELFHNQVTREQGLFSLRFNHPSFGLHLIAANIDADTIILDFPSQRRFVQELKKGYDFVGISFIVPNFEKTKRMTHLIRTHCPNTKIVLGGHGTTIENLENLLDYDFICRGEGVSFFRELLGDHPEKPIVHPIVPAAFGEHIMGIPMKNSSAVLMPGVGCPNGCKFCCTSHFFKKAYIPFLKTGQDIFDVCRRAERELGVTKFFVMDENFLKQRQRAEELLAIMERENKFYRFAIFSSAETIEELGIDFMKRLGVYWLWMGIEGRNSPYAKNRNVDFPKLVSQLRQNGITVLGSIILFTEEHTPDNLHEDVDFAIETGADLLQFMQLGPLPGTALYDDFRRRNLIRDDVPYAEWHGQHRIWFVHPHFSAQDSQRLLKAAFKKAYDALGSSLLRLMETTLMGYLSCQDATLPALIARRRYFKRQASIYYAGLPVIRRFAHNARERAYATDVLERYRRVLGPMKMWQRVQSLAAAVFAFLESARIASKGNLRQPKTLVRHVRPQKPLSTSVAIPGRDRSSRLALDVSWHDGRTRMALNGVLDRVSSRRISRNLADYLRSHTGLLTLDIGALAAIRGDALTQLMKSIERDHDRLSLAYSIQKEHLRLAVARITDLFDRLTVVAV